MSRIKGNSPRSVVHATTDSITRLEDHDFDPRGLQHSRRCEARDPRTDHDDAVRRSLDRLDARDPTRTRGTRNAARPQQSIEGPALQHEDGGMFPRQRTPLDRPKRALQPAPLAPDQWPNPSHT